MSIILNIVALIHVWKFKQHIFTVYILNIFLFGINWLGKKFKLYKEKGNIRQKDDSFEKVTDYSNLKITDLCIMTAKILKFNRISLYSLYSTNILC